MGGWGIMEMEGKKGQGVCDKFLLFWNQMPKSQKSIQMQIRAENRETLQSLSETTHPTVTAVNLTSVIPSEFQTSHEAQKTIIKHITKGKAIIYRKYEFIGTSIGVTGIAVQANGWQQHK